MARLVPLAERTAERVLGQYRDEIIVGDDFDAPLPESIRSVFRGEGA
jgi:antitoxin (DNA-binding transcriptional repressor) of toxin-antitoxin stability system